MSDEEKKSLITYLIKEIQIYPNGESKMPLKSIEFNFPIYIDGREVRKVLWERGNTVERSFVWEKYMNIAQKYVKGLKKAYYENGGEMQWDNFENVVYGASKGDMKKLQELYPDIPNSLLQLLEMVDGTYWREYAEEKVTLLFLGSDMEEYPYFLLSARQMMDTKDDFRAWGDYLINREFDDIPVDEGICDDLGKLCVTFTTRMN